MLVLVLVLLVNDSVVGLATVPAEAFSVKACGVFSAVKVLLLALKEPVLLVKLISPLLTIELPVKAAVA